MILRTCFVLPLLVMLSACDDPPGPDPLSERCVACLTTEERNGCESEWRACESVDECADYAFCQLEALCYARPTSDSCEEDVGCKKPSAATESTDAGDAGDVTAAPRTL